MRQGVHDTALRSADDLRLVMGSPQSALAPTYPSAPPGGIRADRVSALGPHRDKPDTQKDAIKASPTTSARKPAKRVLEPLRRKGTSIYSPLYERHGRPSFALRMRAKGRVFLRNNRPVIKGARDGLLFLGSLYGRRHTAAELAVDQDKPLHARRASRAVRQAQ